MNRNEAIQRLYTDAKIRDAARYLAGDQWQDVLSETITRLYELPDERFNAISSLNNFAFITMRNIVVDGKRKQLDTIPIQHIFTEIPDHTHQYQPDVLLQTFTEYCRSTAEQHRLESVRLMADVVYHYLTYTPTRKRSTRDFAEQTKIEFSTISKYIREIRKLYEDSRNT